MRRRADLAVVAISVLLLGGSLVRLARLAPSQLPTIEQALPEPLLEEFGQVRLLGGNAAELALVTVVGETPPSIDRLQAIESALARVPGVTRTWSSLSRPRLALSDGPAPALRLVSGTAPSPTSRLDAFLAPSPQARVILLGLRGDTATLDGARSLWTALEATLEGLRRPGEVLRACGTPGLRVWSWRQAAADSGRTVPFLVLAVILVPLVCFRALMAALFPLVLSALSTAATLLLYQQVHGALDPWILVLVPLVWAIASMDALHLYEAARRNAGAEAPVARAQRALWLPCLLTAGTTALSLTVLCLPGGPPMLRTFGLWGAIGTAIAYALTFLLAGPMLRLVPPGPLPAWPSRWARRLVCWSRRRPWRVRAGWLALAIASVVLAGRVRVEPKYPHLFTADHPATAELTAVETLVGSTLAPLELSLQATSAPARDPRQLVAAVLTLETYLRTLPETRLSISAATLLEEWLRDDPRAQALIASPSFAAIVARSQEGLLGDPRLGAWVNLEAGAARLSVLWTPMDRDRKEQLIGWLHHFARTMLPGYTLRLGGPGYLYHVAEREGARGLGLGGAVDLGLLLLVLALVLRRGRLVLAGLAGNVLPLVLLLGLMGLLRIPWSMGLLGLPVIVLGLAIDDTVHLLWPLRKGERPPASAFAHAIRHSGTAVVSTGLLLAACLSALSRSGFAVNRELGLLLPAGLLMALLAELTLLPALLAAPPTTGRRRSPRSSP